MGWYDGHNSLILNSHLFFFSFGVVPFFCIWTWILAVTWFFSPPLFPFSSLFSIPHAHPNCFGTHFITLSEIEVI